MKNKKMIFGVIVLLMVFLIPFGQCAKTKYLGSYGEFVEVSLNAQEGDVIRGDYRTYNSPFFVGIGWAYLGESPKFDVFTTYYESGWFEIEISSEGSGTIVIILMNADFWAGGYIEYTITNPTAEERLMTTIIIGVVIGIISVGVIAGIAVHYKNKKKKREAEIIQVQEVIKSKSFYCSYCGAENIDITSDFCSKCGSKIKR